MDIKQNSAGQNPNSDNDPNKDIYSQLLIRTMKGDLEALTKKGSTKPTETEKLAFPTKPAITPQPLPRIKPLPTPSPPTPFKPRLEPIKPAFTQKPATPPASLPIEEKTTKPPALPTSPTPKPTPTLAQLSTEPKPLLSTIKPPVKPVSLPQPPKPLAPPLKPTPILTPTSLTASSGPKKFNKKWGLIIAVFILVALSIWSYWAFFRKTAPQPTTSASPSASPSQSAAPSPLTPPAALFKMEKQKIIRTTGQEGKTINALTELAVTDEISSNFTQILFQDSAQNKFFTLDDLFADLKINPTEIAKIKNYLTENYTFFTFAQKTENATSSPFNPVNEQAQSRAGLIIALTTTTGSTSPVQILRQTETALPQIFNVLFLGRSIGSAASINFLDNTYRNVAIRYLNFPDASLSLDYAIVGNNLLLATSRESTYAAIDRLLAE